MATLNIQHPITDFETWASAFERFADVRREAGVRAHPVQRPIDDPRFVVIDLGFDTSEQAEAFLRFLNTNVWANRANAPALAGDPQTMILEPVGAEYAGPERHKVAHHEEEGLPRHLTFTAHSYSEL